MAEKRVGVFAGITKENYRAIGNYNYEIAVIISEEDLSSVVKSENDFVILMLDGMSPQDIFIKAERFFTPSPKIFYSRCVDVHMFDKSDYLDRCLRAMSEGWRIAILNHGNSCEDSLIGIHNTLDNLDIVREAPDLSSYKDRFKDKPGVLLASGPTINTTFDWMKGLENAVTVCCDNTLYPLVTERNFNPDFVVSLERVPHVEKYLEFDYGKTIPILSHVCTRKQWENGKGKAISASSHASFSKFLHPNRYRGHIGSHSACMALRALLEFGCNPIYLLGQDFAYGEGDTHIRGAMPSQHLDGQGDIQVPSCSGGETTSTKLWDFYKRHTQHAIHTSPEVKVYNVNTGNGASIQGTEWIGNPDDLPTFEKFEKDFSVKEIIPPITNEERNRAAAQMREFACAVDNIRDRDTFNDILNRLDTLDEVISTTISSVHIWLLTRDFAGEATEEDWKMWADTVAPIAEDMAEMLEVE